MNEKKQEPQVSGSDPTQLPIDAKRAQKVRSSRFEWEAKTGEAETGQGLSNTARISLMAPVVNWLAKLFSGSRDFFDKDDDATPSAA